MSIMEGKNFGETKHKLKQVYFPTMKAVSDYLISFSANRPELVSLAGCANSQLWCHTTSIPATYSQYGQHFLDLLLERCEFWRSSEASPIGVACTYVIIFQRFWDCMRSIDALFNGILVS